MDLAILVPKRHKKLVRVDLLAFELLARGVGRGHGRLCPGRKGNSSLQVEWLILRCDVRQITGRRVTVRAVLSEVSLAIGRFADQQFLKGVLGRYLSRNGRRSV